MPISPPGSRPAAAPKQLPSAPAVLAALKRLGYQSFRPGQREAIEAIFSRGRLLLVAPTGGGKSLTYQLPATLLPGTTLVISPLVSLMHDQVAALSARGVAATFLAATLPAEETRRRMAGLARGWYSLAYVAPERLAFPGFRALARDLGCPLVAVDEAHCISEWGHDFRPEYLAIGGLLAELPEARVLACTATATPVVRDEILARLGLPADTPQLIRGFARPNLALRVCEVRGRAGTGPVVDRTLREALGGPGAGRGTAIVYAPTRRQTEEETSRLAGQGWRVAPYHAGLGPSERDQASREFRDGALEVVVATNAFGMGIDRPDVRAVVHLAPPGSIEAYYQEVGRAGRDGEPALGVLCTSPSDLPLRRRLLEQPVDGMAPDPARVEHRWQLFLELMRWAEGGSCRHDAILRYFGDEAETLAGCGRCDVCMALGEPDAESAETTAMTVRKALAAVARVDGRLGRFGLQAAVKLLAGVPDPRLQRSALDRCKTFGALRDRSEEWLMALLRRCVAAGWVDFTTGDRPLVLLTPAGKGVLFGSGAVRLLLPPDESRCRGARPPRERAPRTSFANAGAGRRRISAEGVLAPADAELFERLRARRLELARAEGVPPYVVAADRTLRELAELKPRSLAALETVFGIGPARAAKYGKELLAVVGSALLLVALALPMLAGVAQAQAGDRPAVQALRLGPEDHVRLDGVLEEGFWEQAEAVTEFLQQEPREGDPATERTEVRIAYDAANLYIGASLFDSDPRGVRGRQRQRDARLDSDDRFMWILDTFSDARTGYFFEINPAGLMGDGLISGPGNVNKSWDGVWEARVARGSHGWSAEIRIPFSTINFDRTRGAWGVNFQRTIRRRGEEVLWSGHRRGQGLTYPAHAGVVHGLAELSQGVGLEVKPYVVGSWQRAPARGRPDAEMPADAGVDLTYSILPSLRASLTLNTDFAEAEVDQRRVNLTRFPLFFPERRDFFLEGSSVYSFAPSSGPTPYFSRRIGLVDGDAVPVRWGARLAGQVGPHDLGFLQVRTGSHAGGPAEDFTVARVKRRFLEQSAVGLIYTRRASGGTTAPSGQEGHTLGADLDLRTSRLFGRRNLQFEAFAVWHSDPSGDSSSFGDRLARGVRLNYPNDRVRAHVSFRQFGTAYQPPVGFVPRNGFRRLQPTVYLQPRPNWRGVRQLEFGAEMEHLVSLRTGRLETFNTRFTLFGIRFLSGDYGGLSVRSDFERLPRDFAIRPGIVIPAGDYTFRSWTAELSSAPQRPMVASIEIGGGQFWSGTRFRHELDLTLAPAPGLSLGGEWERNRVSLPAGQFTTNLLRGSGGWQVNPWVSLTGTVQFDDVTRVVGLFGRFRWIVRPGSEVYVVYTHNIGRMDPLDPHAGYETLERRVATKLTYAHRF